MKKEEFYKVWKDSSREDILNQYYYDYDYMVELIDRKNKAIEYIENKTDKVKYKEIGITEKRLYLIHNQVDNLLDILKGSDTNE